MKTPVRALAAILVLSVMTSGCVTLYTLDPVPDDKDALTRDQSAMTLSKDGVTVTVGPLTSLYGADLTFGVLIANNSPAEIETDFGGPRISLNGRPLALIAHQQIKQDAAFIQKSHLVIAAASAATASLAESNAVHAASAQGRTLTPFERQQAREGTASPSRLGESLVKLSDAMTQGVERAGTQEAHRLAARSNSVTWDDTRQLRPIVAREPSVADGYYWRPEKIPAGARVFRVIWTERTALKKLEGGEGHATVAIRLGEHDFVYRFHAVPRSFAEAEAEAKKRDARAAKQM